jgi:hypothetical protein
MLYHSYPFASSLASRSDVGYAIHRDVVSNLGDDFICENFHDANIKHIVGSHHLYIYRDIKGANDRFREIDQILTPFKEKFLKVDICEDDPLFDKNDLGCWVDNPWALRRHIRAELLTYPF